MHFCYKMVHCETWDWCILGFVHDKSIVSLCFHTATRTKCLPLLLQMATFSNTFSYMIFAHFDLNFTEAWSQGLNDNRSALVQVNDWYWAGNKPLPDSMIQLTDTLLYLYPSLIWFCVLSTSLSYSHIADLVANYGISDTTVLEMPYFTTKTAM